MAVLVAYDGSEPAQKAAKYAFAEHPEEELVFFRVVELAGGSTGAGLELARELLSERDQRPPEEQFDAIVDLADDGTFETEIAVGNPAREIVEFAEDPENEIEHIIIGNHGRKGVSRVLLGSVAEKVVRRAAVPVTVVR